MLKRFLIPFLLGIIVSFFVFPVYFTFLPETLNTKMITAVIGLFAFAYDCIEKKTFSISNTTLVATILAIIFSLVCFYSITINNTEDTTYSRYWLSFATWIGGAYGVYYLIRIMSGSCALDKLTQYLAAVCVAQCILALLIDNIPTIKEIVDNLTYQDQERMSVINRLYGIGAMLDTAGCRFSVILVLMAHQMTTNNKVLNSIGLSLFYFISFAVIIIVGSIIARTTWVGAIIALVYMVVSFLRFRKGYLSKQQISFWFYFLGVVVVTVVICTILYNTSDDFRYNLRFGFEGFFNWVETGVFRTDSTDKLNNTMWVWPSNTRSWIIGTGLFADWVYGTDIGYCRFTLYCGLVGLVIFSIFFIYNGIAVASKFRNFTMTSIFLIALTFIIWLKVSTDIFFIYALLFCLEPETLPDSSCTSSTT